MFHVSKLLRSGLILENIRRLFLLSIRATGKMNMDFDEKHSLDVLGNQTRLQNSAYTIRKSLIFRVLCALFEQIPSGINRDILNTPTQCGAKNSNKLRALSDSPHWRTSGAHVAKANTGPVWWIMHQQELNRETILSRLRYKTPTRTEHIFVV